MTDKEPLPTYDWRIRIKGQTEQPVHAAYFQSAHHGEFFEFKDGYHKTIYTVAKDVVVDIGRHDPERIKLDSLGRRL